MAAASPTLTCKQCNYENEAERVYCHNCGAKLDRTLLPKDTAKIARETQEKNAKRIRKMVSPARGFFTNWHKALINTLLSAVSVAAIIQMARPPRDGIPPIPSKDDLLNAPHLLEGIEDVEMSQAQQVVKIKESDANLYLATAVKAQAGTQDDYFQFNRAFVNMGKDVIRVTAQESAFGYPIYAGASYKLSIAGGKLVPTNAGGNLGRLPVHPMIMEYCGFAFQQLWDALQHEKELLDKVQSVSVQPGVFIFTTKPHA
jgi:hypothetical protein